jgi:hypothetical protein
VNDFELSLGDEIEMVVLLSLSENSLVGSEGFLPESEIQRVGFLSERALKSSGHSSISSWSTASLLAVSMISDALIMADRAMASTS